MGSTASWACAWRDEAEDAHRRAKNKSVTFSYTVAHYQLGTVLEARGDKDRACASYQVVLDRWASAKTSVAAKAAAKRAKALRCPGI
jgi:hypothetical protein